ncbi:unnamed protein product [Schistosoma mattheei]|uniref:Uncharacterized protein n=1 Tax=Schistosoma mattheei TaxID=31246 RepID=A0AA85ASL4_9TREM|nr:unnamed protein product [Schistosoma mattheei]
MMMSVYSVVLFHIKFINFCNTVILKTKEGIRKKLEKSCCNNNNLTSFPINPDKYVTNLSSIVLSVHEKEALSLGLKFSVPITQISELTVNAQFENLYDQLSTLTPSSLENQSWFKAKLVDIAHHFHSFGPKQRSILTSQHFKSLKELRNNADIIILKPDKGSGVVIMNKSDYKNKMESILSDKSKFLADVDFDGLRKLEKKVNSNLVKLLNMNAINKDEFNLLKPMGSAYPNLYGLPKIHKPNTPSTSNSIYVSVTYTQPGKMAYKIIKPYQKSIL